MKNYFTDEEIAYTGADPADVKDELLYRLNLSRADYGKPFHLLNNGLTTGEHDSQEHPDGRAADITTREKMPNIIRLVSILTANGFGGIGVYRNHVNAYSFHADLRRSLVPVMWYGYKDKAGDDWTMTNNILHLFRGVL